jgi:amino-acid N-acetyltransferase
MKYSLRPALQRDQATIRRLVLGAGINPTGLRWPRFVVAVTPEGEVIACAQVRPHFDGTRELASLVVAPRWRGRGLARALIEHLLAAHSGELYLMCRASLASLYRKFGFVPVSEEQMPPYFRRIKRLARLVEWLSKEGEYLLVMRRG